MFSEVPENFEFEWKVENVFLESETLDSPVFRIGFLDQSTWFFRLLASRNRCEWHRCENLVIRKGRSFKVSIQVQIRQFNSGIILEEWSNPELKIDSDTSHVFFEDVCAKEEQHPPSPQIETLTVQFLVQDLTSHENSSTRFNNTPRTHSSSMADLSASWTDNYDHLSSFLPKSSRCFSRTDIMQKTVNWTMDKMGHGERRVLYLEPSIRNVSALQLSVTNESGKLHLGVEKTDCQTASVLHVVAEWAEDPEYFKVSCRFDEQHTSHRFDTGIQLNSIKDDIFRLTLDIKEVKDGECHPDKRSRFLTRRSRTNVTREIGEDMLKMYRDKMGIDVKLRTSCGKVFCGHGDFLVSSSLKFKALLLQVDELNQKEAFSRSLEENNESHVPEERKIVENDEENKWVVVENQNILKSNAIGSEKDEQDALQNLRLLKREENQLTLDAVHKLSDHSVEVNALESPSNVIPHTNFKGGKEMSKNSEANQGMCDNIDTLHSVTTNYSPEDCTLSEHEMTCSPHDFKRNWDSESTIFDISDLDAETLDYLLIFLYSASLEEELELHALLKIYKAAYLYHVPDLQDLCRRRLERVHGSGGSRIWFWGG